MAIQKQTKTVARPKRQFSEIEQATVPPASSAAALLCELSSRSPIRTRSSNKKVAISIPCPSPIKAKAAKKIVKERTEVPLTQTVIDIENSNQQEPFVVRQDVKQVGAKKARVQKRGSSKKVTIPISCTSAAEEMAVTKIVSENTEAPLSQSFPRSLLSKSQLSF
eukprot:TRINITY_DN7138_c0_g2_i4.p1 TRINITY_DN7138_c0_g2~~TRINITY_DN7138_c0_g2_i4.p1  ORF type:complete len:180 (+),score=32.27 TRINITY_DN7138_c0_g2_i4:47-541(+)